MEMMPTTPGELTHAEIFQQPELWPDTVRRVRAAGVKPPARPVITGAGTSFFAALAVEAGWPGARAIPSTDLFLDFARVVAADGAVLSLARSGDSPESTAVVERVQRALPGVRHVAITCNPEGKLARWPGLETIVLDARTNDRSLVMTSSFSNLVLAGLALARPEEVETALPLMCAGWDALLPKLDAQARALAMAAPPRLVTLASAPLAGAAREAWLKVLEMTGGQVATLAETYLGVRHGPMSFLEAHTPVVCFVSSDAARRRYEMDLVRELRAKKLGRLVAVGQPETDSHLFEAVVTTPAAGLPDWLRTPAEIVFAQLLGYHLSLTLGLDPDSPSPGRVITRVVEGVRVYPEDE
jgi:tagatose-6-phosphate ketose/aldose isomerase